jgi:hypothetical protein
MALAEDTNPRGRARLPVIAILVLVALMALVGGVLAASSSPSSQIPVFVLEKGRFTAFDAPGPAPRGALTDFGSDADRKGGPRGRIVRRAWPVRDRPEGPRLRTGPGPSARLWSSRRMARG